MKLIYNGVDLTGLGTVRILSHSTVRDPVEAPQRERVTYKVRLDFFESTFRDNFGLIEQLRGALKTQQADLLWQDDSGATFVDRTVTAGEDEALEETGQRGGNYWQAVVFQFWYFNHDVVTHCLSATAAGLDLGAVSEWSERLDITRWDELRSARKLVQGGVTASGRLQSDTTLGVAERQAWLLAAKDALIASLLAGSTTTVQFGTFNKAVKVTQFRAEVNQPHNYITWSLTATYTAYPDETSYAWLEVRIVTRENREEGIPRLTLSGRIGAATLAAAQARLATWKTALIPSGYAMLSDENTQPQMISESGTGGDGTIFTEISFSSEYRDASGKSCTFQRTAPSAPRINLGTVDKFRDGYTVELFNEMRSNRKRAGGTVTIGGKWFTADTLTAPQRVAALETMKATWDAEVVKGSSGSMVYGTVFSQTVRVLDFSAQVDREKYFIDWSLTASWTRFPNEADYAMCELRVSDRQDRAEGTWIKTLSGRIGAPTQDAAQAKLVRFRAAMIPAGYVLKTNSGEGAWVEVESDFAKGNKGDGVAFIELSVNEEWQLTAGQVLTWRLRSVPDFDPRSPWVKTTYSGLVTACGATGAAAYATAAAQAATLGDNQGAFRVRASVTQTSFLVQTDGQVIVTVEFNYEYQGKATGSDARIYTEVTGELAAETFGYTTETVSGWIAAQTLALAQQFYQNNVRNTGAYQGALLMNERKLTLSQQRLDTPTTSLASGDDRYTFSFQVLRPKNGTESAMSYTIDPLSNFQTREKVTTVTGTVYASTQDAANGLIDTLMATLSLGKRLRFRRAPRFQQGPQVGTGGAQTQPSSGLWWQSAPTGGGGAGAAVTVLMAVDFTEEWIDLLTGMAGLLECECSEEVTYPGNRIVEKPIPDGPPIIQQPGQTAGRRTVTARAVGTTESSARAWVLGIGAAMLTGSGIPRTQYAYPPQINTGFKYLPQTAGVPRGTGANPKLVEVSGTFSEVLIAATV